MTAPTIAELNHALDALTFPKHRAVIAMLEEMLEAAEQSESEAAAVDREDLKERSRLSADHDASR